MPVNKDYYTLAGSSGQSTGYTIDQSIRFARTDNTTGGSCMHRTPSGAGNRKKWTFSLWFKLGYMNNFAQGSGHYYGIFSVDAATNDANRAIWTIASPSGGSDFFRMQFQGHGTIFMLTTREFRDPSAWYHAVLVWDTARSVASERQALYINGEKESDFQTFTNPTDEQEIGMNLASRTLIGASRNISSSQDIYRWDGYMADIHFLDGYAYGPEYFGEFDSNGIWIPIEYTGSYGSNGFFIDGRDSSDLGDDESGNGNDFTTINHAAHDQVTDTPTNNFCTINPLYRGSSSTAQHYGSVSEGNLFIEHNGAYDGGQLCTQLFESGKWYWEVYIKAGGNSSSYQLGSGIAAVNDGYTKSDGRNEGARTGEIGFNSYNGVVKFANSTTKTYSEAPFSDTDIIQVAVDADNGAIYYGKNGTFMGSGDPTSGSSKTNAGATWTPASYSGGWVPTTYVGGGGTPEIFINFGQEGTFAGNITAGGNSDGNGIGNFKYSPPSGYLAVCTKNLGS